MKESSSSSFADPVNGRPKILSWVRFALLAQAISSVLAIGVFFYCAQFFAESYETYLVPGLTALCIGIGLLLGTINLAILFVRVRRALTAHSANNP